MTLPFKTSSYDLTFHGKISVNPMTLTLKTKLVKYSYDDIILVKQYWYKSYNLTILNQFGINIIDFTILSRLMI